MRPPFYDAGTAGGIPGYVPGEMWDPNALASPPFAVAPPPGAVFNPLAPAGWQAGFPTAGGIGPGGAWTRLMGTAYGNQYAGGAPRGAALTRTRLVRCCPCRPGTGRVFRHTPGNGQPGPMPNGFARPGPMPVTPPGPVGPHTPPGVVVNGPMFGGGVDPEMGDVLAPGMQMTSERKPFPWLVLALAALGLRG